MYQQAAVEIPAYQTSNCYAIVCFKQFKSFILLFIQRIVPVYIGTVFIMNHIKQFIMHL